MTQQNAGMLIWTGRIHLGDDPGVFGDATYAGLQIELPVTLDKFDPKADQADDICFVIAADHVSAGGISPHHEVALYVFEREPSHTEWTRTKIGGPFGLDGSIARARPSSVLRSRYVAIHVAVDTAAAPGLYNDLVLTSLTLESTTHYAEFGFRASRA